MQITSCRLQRTWNQWPKPSVYTKKNPRYQKLRGAIRGAPSASPGSATDTERCRQTEHWARSAVCRDQSDETGSPRGSHMQQACSAVAKCHRSLYLPTSSCCLQNWPRAVRVFFTKFFSRFISVSQAYM